MNRPSLAQHLTHLIYKIVNRVLFYMNDISNEQIETDKLRTLKLLTAAIYLCQALTFMLAGLPLLVGVAINFIKRNEVQGTWLESLLTGKLKPHG